MNIKRRLRTLKNEIDEMREAISDADALTRFKKLHAQGVAPGDLSSIVGGDWNAVQSPLLRESQHRERWQHAAPMILVAMESDEPVVSA